MQFGLILTNQHPPGEPSAERFADTINLVRYARDRESDCRVQPPTARPDGDIPPGIDGGPMDADQSYVFRRQPTFYRTLQPAGTVIIDKFQHFLYLVQPNSVALRYGIGIGRQCADLIGLRHVASMAEWPSWEAPPDTVKEKLAQSGTLAGAPGNPLGARVLELDDNRSRVHGTNAPKTIGTNVEFGCIRLVNDDIVDLYARLRVGSPVLVN